MGRKFVIAMLSAMIFLTVYLTDFVPVGFPIQDSAEVYAVCGDEKVLINDKDADMVKKLLGKKYDSGYGVKCPFYFGIGFEVRDYRYAIAMDGCDGINMYSLDGKLLHSGGNPFSAESASAYYYKYFDDDNIREYFENTY